MPHPPFSRGRGGYSRRLSRSISPSPNRHKRSWLLPSDRNLPRDRSPSPVYKGPRKNIRSSPGYRRSSLRSRSRSPRHQKRPRWRSPGEGGHSRHHARGDRPGDYRGRPRSRSRHRSNSPKPPPKSDDSRRSHTHRGRKMGSPDDKYSGPSTKKKARQSSPPLRKRSASGSPSLSYSVRNSKDAGGKSSRSGKTEESVSRKVNSSSKKKAARITLHKRFSTDDLPPFELNKKDNVTIAILRNATANPSEDVTVERVFDATLFKMVHKKHEGRRPIFDREEIKVWKHDENLTDDPDFERRLIRVKSAPHKVGDSLTRMSPEVLRKAFGLDISGERSMSRSPQREQQIRLDPRPDPRYEAKYRQQMEKREEVERHSKPERKSSADNEYRRHEDRKGEGHESGKKRNKEDMYDLRQALERRRSDREEEDDFNVEQPIRNRHFSDDDRNIVFNRKPSRYNDDFDSRGSRRGRWEGEPQRFTFGRGRGRGIRGPRGGSRFRQDWSPERGISEERDRDSSWDRRNNARSFDRRPVRVSVSPPSNRGWRGGGGGFRGRGRGMARSFDVDDRIIDIRGSPPADGYNKYSQHDDRDASPRMVHGRPFRARRIARGFGSKGFRGTRGLRTGWRGLGFRVRGRARGTFGFKGDREDRFHDVSVEREWKHDMYDSLQTEEPHSTT